MIAGPGELLVQAKPESSHPAWQQLALDRNYLPDNWLVQRGPTGARIGILTHISHTLFCLGQ
ncbi:hypothetical protein ASPFODRAFT_719456 [Aspergillus luchuensis CBS 106.47]|uniref:Uncharacterized protein n=1 Tax=Aspergillus luchuensis (strain CBS 106.47) TaxID=1137211 RepID=A0A1M3TEE7_ASPLC|nr:hypothetical protein ASPFODRAFT_719456 [Aspergillus luchuensis CBS 106.47]